MEGIGNFLANKVESVKTNLQERFSPEKYVESAAPFIKELSLSANEIAWIADVLKTSRQTLKKEQLKKRKQQDEATISDHGAFDLIYIHLMLLRDIKKGGVDFISRETEEALDDMIAYIMIQVERLKSRVVVQQEEYAKRVEKYFTHLQSPQDKAAAISRFLDWWHSDTFNGPGNSMTRRFFVGWPHRKNVMNSDMVQGLYGPMRGERMDGGTSYIPGSVLEEHEFFIKLNNLGNPEFWKKVAEYEK